MQCMYIRRHGDGIKLSALCSSWLFLELRGCACRPLHVLHLLWVLDELMHGVHACVARPALYFGLCTSVDGFALGRAYSSTTWLAQFCQWFGRHRVCFWLMRLLLGSAGCDGPVVAVTVVGGGGVFALWAAKVSTFLPWTGPFCNSTSGICLQH